MYKDVQKVFVDLGANKSIVLVDMPGIGESELRDEEYIALYKSILPELDIILWLIKADDRSLIIDEVFFNSVVKPYISHGKSFIIVLNQVDKIEPYLEWDHEKHVPGLGQLENITLKVLDLSIFFEFPSYMIIPVSTSEGYNLMRLVDEMINSLPNEKKIVVLSEIKDENVSKRTKDNALRSFLESIDLWCSIHIPSYTKAKEFIQNVIEVLIGK